MRIHIGFTIAVLMVAGQLADAASTGGPTDGATTTTAAATATMAASVMADTATAANGATNVQTVANGGTATNGGATGATNGASNGANTNSATDSPTGGNTGTNGAGVSDGVTEMVNTGTGTEESMEGGNTGTEEPQATTQTTPMEKICYMCNGTDCSTARTDDHVNDTCISTLGICFMYFDESTNETTRGCNSTKEYTTTCASPYPHGSYASGSCTFCCTDEKCNSQAVNCDNVKGHANFVTASTSLLAMMGILTSLLSRRV